MTPTPWHLTIEQRISGLEKHLQLLQAWQDLSTLPVEGWTFQAPHGAEVPIHVGDLWPVVDPSVAQGPVFFRASVVVPQDWQGRPVELELDVGGEGLVTLSSGLRGGLNPYHRRFAVEETEVQVEVQAVPKGLFGQPSARPALNVAQLCLPDTAVRTLLLQLQLVVDAAKELPSHEAVPHLLHAAEKTIAGLDWPTHAQEHLARLPLNPAVISGDLWNVPHNLPTPSPLSAEMQHRVLEASKQLSADLRALQSIYPQQGLLKLSGHAHLDLAWLWPVPESRRKAERTFETVLHLMDFDPDFTFNQSSAQLYAWIEEQNPELFERIRQRVKEGRWEAIGGMWVEPDGQMPSGEAMVRQLLYGQRYFQEKLGVKSRVAWLPDTFGFAGNLPQLFQQAGMPYFFTTKLSWNETTPFPHDLWTWEGLDGSTVTAHLFKNNYWGMPGMGSYNGDISPAHTVRVWKNNLGKQLNVWQGRMPESLFTFGFGDGAGGPTHEMLQRYTLLQDLPAVPAVQHSTVEAFFDGLPQKALPVWSGEMYFELHRGTLTSQAETKRLNRRLEQALVSTETLLTLQGKHQQHHAQLEQLWKTLLLNQFHDILPGSSIHEVYQESHQEMQDALQQTLQLQGQDPSGNWIFNPTLQPRPLTVVLPMDQKARFPGGQAVQEGWLCHHPEVQLSALGSVALPASLPETHGVRVETTAEGFLLENRHLRVQIQKDGTLSSILDLDHQREVLAGPSNRLVVFPDLPRDWEAWDVDGRIDLPENGQTLTAAEVQVLEEGPLRAAVQVVWKHGHSSIEVTYQLLADSRELCMDTRVDWQERRTLLKTFFEVQVRSPEFTAETLFGMVKRPTHRNHKTDAARFETCAQRFIDLSETGYGVALLNDSKYGHSVRGKTMGLTLLRGPMYPDPQADLGKHHFRYALLPHAGDVCQAHVMGAAEHFNGPLVLLPDCPSAAPFVLKGLTVMLSCLKGAEDGGGLVVRLFEPYGARGAITLTASGGNWQQLNLLEEPLGECSKDQITVQVKPFEVVTLQWVSSGP